ncbi:MAG TPA: hypothetical protein VFZ00_27340 [Solirubrobacter sp.]|nr:hypothetical protein [Solirubrobacter sp.]
MRAHLEETVETLDPPAPAVPLEAVAAVMAFLAAHPERRDEAVLTDALRVWFPDGELPSDLEAWLDGRRRSALPKRRAHGPAPRSHVRTRPAVPEAETG